MTFDLAQLMEERHGENFQLHAQYLNPQLTKVVSTIGFDRFYERGEGAYLYDQDGKRYLDYLSGFGVFALGRNHPVLQKALHDAIDANLPNLIQMDAALLPGVLANEILARCHEQMGRVFFTNSGSEPASKITPSAPFTPTSATTRSGFHRHRSSARVPEAKASGRR